MKTNKVVVSLLSLALVSQVINAQQKPVPKLNPQAAQKQVVATPPPPPPPVVQKPLPFKKTASGIEYYFAVNKPTSPLAQEGDVVKIHLRSVIQNRIMYESYTKNKGGKPAEFGVTKPTFKGDIVEIIKMMTPGDSVIATVDAAELFKANKQKLPDFAKPKERVIYFLKLISIKTKEQVQKEQQLAFNKQIQEQMKKQQAAQKIALAKEDKILQNYFTKNNIKPTKTASGLYYTITEQGTGATPAKGDIATMNYTGRLLDGTKFDSNEDSLFHHVQPFEFPLGQGRVIRGWDEGVALLNKGTKAVLYIPSPLAYGAQAQPANPNNPKGIPANSPLVFNVQLVDFKNPPPPPPPAPPTSKTEEKTKAVETPKVEIVPEDVKKDIIEPVKDAIKK